MTEDGRKYERPKYISRNAVQKMVRKTWLLYLQAEKSGIAIDQSIYQMQRKVALRAIDLGDPKFKEEYKLP